MKRVISLILGMCMLISASAFSVSAETSAAAAASGATVVVVDNNRSRIELPSAVSIAAGESYSVDFTVPVDGNYAFMANKNKDYYGYISATLTSGGETVWSVSNAEWTGATSGKNKPYARVGKGTTGTVALTKDTAYTLTLTPSALATTASGCVTTLTTSYIDVLCTDIVADGKKLVQPYFYKSTGQNGDHFLNCADNQPNALSYINANMAEYTIPGKPQNNELADWKFIQATPMPARTNHIEFDIIAPTNGKYIFQFAGEQYTSGNGPIDETLYIKVDGTDVGTVLYDASSEADKFQVMSTVLDLTAGHHVVRVQRNTTGTWTQPGGTHTYMAIPFVSIEPKAAEVIYASDNLTRIETASTVVIASGETKSFEFTVPKDGNYAFMSGHPTDYRQFFGNIKAVLINKADGTNTTICENAVWTGTASGAKDYRRIGNGDSGTVALKAGVTYAIALTPTATDREGKQKDVGITHIDVLCTDIPLAEDIVIPTQYYSLATQTNEHFLSNADYRNWAGTYIANNFPRSKVIGKPDSTSALHTPYYPAAISTILGKTNKLEYTLEVEKAGYYEIATHLSVHSGSSVASHDTVYFRIDDNEEVGALYAPPSYAERDQDAKALIYIPEGKHTLHVYRRSDSTNKNDVMYIAFLALTKQYPEAHMYAGSVSEENEIYTVQDGTMVAQIQTKGTVAVGDVVNAFFAIYDNDKQMVAVDAYTGNLENDTITLTIANFKKTAGKTYKAKAFLWNENYWGEQFLLAEGLDELLDFTVTIPEGRDAVVLQLSDTQIIDSSQMRSADRLGKTLADYTAPDQIENRLDKYVRETVAATNPDLILLAGDIVYGEFDDSGSSFAHVVELMESFRIPWAPVFGNHEGESAKGFDWQCELLENAEYCLFKQRTLTGNGNYTVGIEQGGELKRVFFMMDSNGCGGMSAASKANGHSIGTTGFASDQVAWFEKVGNRIQAQVPGVKVSFCFHIQMKKFQDACAYYGFVAGDASSVPIDVDTHPNKKDSDFGYIGTSFGSGWDENGEIYEKMKSIGMDSMLVGHAHAENISTVYDGVRFQFGMKSSVYDSINYLKSDGTIEQSYIDVGFPLVGGTVMHVSEADGAFRDCLIYTCKNEY